MFNSVINMKIVVKEEVELAIGLRRHPHIVNMADVFETKYHLFTVIDLCKGGSLCKFISKKDTIKEVEVALIVGQLASALVFLHKNYLVDRASGALLLIHWLMAASKARVTCKKW